MNELRMFQEELVKRVRERDETVSVEFNRSFSLQGEAFDVIIRSEKTGRADAYHVYKEQDGSWNWMVMYVM